jgi:hypothetical protein
MAMRKNEMFKLSREQRNRLNSVKHLWNKQFRYFDEQKAVKGIECIYRYCGLKKPQIVFADSLFECKTIANLIDESNEFKPVLLE